MAVALISVTAASAALDGQHKEVVPSAGPAASWAAQLRLMPCRELCSWHDQPGVPVYSRYARRAVPVTAKARYDRHEVGVDVQRGLAWKSLEDGCEVRRAGVCEVKGSIGGKLADDEG